MKISILIQNDWMLTIFSPLPASLSLEIPFKQNYEMKKESCFKIIFDNVATSLIQGAERAWK